MFDGDIFRKMAPNKKKKESVFFWMIEHEFSTYFDLFTKDGMQPPSHIATTGMSVKHQELGVVATRKSSVKRGFLVLAKLI